MLNPKTQKESLNRLGRIEGQVRGIQKMVEDRKYCIDILTQITAVRRALERVALLVMQQHMGTCVTEAISSRKGEPKIKELMKTIDQFLR